MPDGKKSGKVRKFLRVAGGILDVVKLVPGPHTPFMPWIERAIDGAEIVNGPGGGGEKKKLTLDTLNEVFDALESRGLFEVPAELREALPEIIDAVVEIKNTTGVFPKDGEEGTITKAMPADFRESTAYPARFNFSGPGTIEFKVDP